MHFKKKGEERSPFTVRERVGKSGESMIHLVFLNFFPVNGRLLVLMTIKKYSINLHFIHTNAETEGR